MLTYVLDVNGQPLMPTRRCGKVRHLLDSGKAKVVKRCPFTIQLLYQSTTYTQPVDLGMDTGYGNIGVSAVAEGKEIYASEIQPRQDISKKLETRRTLRRGRRSRKTRYRKPRFDNRGNARREGRLAPSVRQLIETHKTAIKQVFDILPVTSISVEVAAFDTQKMQNHDIQGVEYQQGTLQGYEVREYLKNKFGGKCAYCGKPMDGKTKFEVEHVVPKSRGGSSRIANLVWSCHDCNQKKGNQTAEEFGHPEVTEKSHKLYKPATTMGVVKTYLIRELREAYGDIRITYGYQTAFLRNKYDVEKSHAADARCIAGHPDAEPLGYVFYQKKVRCHNRQLHKLTIGKGGYRKNNQTPYEVKGFRLFDKVRYNGQIGFITGRRATGSFAVKTFEGGKISDSVSYKKLKLVETGKHYLVERMDAAPPHA